MDTRWQVDETYLKIGGPWRYVYRVVDQHCQVIDVYVSPRRDTAAARRFFGRAITTTRTRPVEVVTDRYANNRMEADHGRLKARLRPMRGLKHERGARIIIAGQALVQNIRRGHYELAVEAPATRRVAVAFDELAPAI